MIDSSIYRTEEQYEIMTAADNIPIRNVNFILLDAVVSHREEWFDIFLEVLKNGGYGSVAEKIEEGLAEEFMGDHYIIFGHVAV